MRSYIISNAIINVCLIALGFAGWFTNENLTGFMLWFIDCCMIAFTFRTRLRMIREQEKKP